MPTECRHCPLRKLSCFKPFSRDDERTMQDFKVGEIVVDANRPILTEGTQSQQLYTVLDGMALRYKLLPNGRRQVINVVFPGDFLGLQAELLGELKHSVETVSKTTLCVFDKNAFWSFVRAHPDRALDIAWLTAIEEHLLGSSLLSLGQRSARERIAWAILSLYKRAEALNLVEKNVMALPIRQQDLADALGLSLVHTNKTLAYLRDQKLADWRGKKMVILDEPRLFEMAIAEPGDFETLRPLM